MLIYFYIADYPTPQSKCDCSLMVKVVLTHLGIFDPQRLLTDPPHTSSNWFCHCRPLLLCWDSQSKPKALRSCQSCWQQADLKALSYADVHCKWLAANGLQSHFTPFFFFFGMFMCWGFRGNRLMETQIGFFFQANNENEHIFKNSTFYFAEKQWQLYFNFIFLLLFFSLRVKALWSDGWIASVLCHSGEVKAANHCHGSINKETQRWLKNQIMGEKHKRVLKDMLMDSYEGIWQPPYLETRSLSALLSCFQECVSSTPTWLNSDARKAKSFTLKLHTVVDLNSHFSLLMVWSFFPALLLTLWHMLQFVDPFYLLWKHVWQWSITLVLG